MDMTNNKQQTAVDWFFDQLVANRIIVINGTTYWDKVKTKYEILMEQAKEMEVMGKEMSYSDGYAEGYKRALDYMTMSIKNAIETK
jgi:uncharacterized iron-regulated protein